MSRLTHFPDNWLTDGCEVVSLTPGHPLLPREIPDTHFCQRLSRPQSHSAARRIRPIEKIQWPHRDRTRNLPACSTVPQPTTLPRAPICLEGLRNSRWAGRDSTHAPPYKSQRPHRFRQFGRHLRVSWYSQRIRLEVMRELMTISVLLPDMHH
jgi:hypothetical protein